MNNEWITWLLNATLFAPIVGIPLILLMKRNTAKYLAFGFSLLPLLVGVALHSLYRLSPDPSLLYDKDFVFFSESLWFTMDNINIKYMIGVDGISAYMVLLTTLIFPILVLYSWGRAEKQEKLYYVMLLLLETGILGFFLSLDLLMFYVFFEMVLIPTCFFIGLWGGAKREQASMKFFLYTLVGSLVMLVAIIYLGLNVREGYLTTDYFEIRNAIAAGTIPAFSLEAQKWLFLAFFAGFAIKLPLFPLHTWQPLTYAESGTTGSVILAALLSKMGAYGFIRFCLPYFPEMSMYFAPFICTLAVISIVYGGYLAVVQTNLKKMIAYASLSHLGFITLGIFSFSEAALSGAVIQMTAHGIATAALFLLAGMLFERYKTKDIRNFQGIAKVAPRFTLFFMITVLATLGLPGLSGFVGEFMILLGSFNSSAISSAFAIVAALGMVIGAVYLLNTFRRMMFGEVVENIKNKMFDLRKREVALVMPLIAFMFFIGLYATPFLSQINKGSDRVMKIVESRLENPQLTATPANEIPQDRIQELEVIEATK
ncbi:MAG: NADH-quinone oxidoreductase subunit M [Bacteroidota bacterium]